ncbi:MAG: hypothetical protein DIU75_016400 [Mycolicibacterium hassiacum]
MQTRRIRLLVSVAGLDFSWRSGEVVELPAAEAAKWADGERAVFADDIEPETARGGAGEDPAPKRRGARRAR